MTLAPPDLPFPLLDMASRILKHSLPSGVPCEGFSFSEDNRDEKSDLNDGYFLANRFTSFSNLGMNLTL